MKTLKNIVYSTLTAGVLAMVPGCSTIGYGNKVDLEGIARWEPQLYYKYPIGDCLELSENRLIPEPIPEFYFCLYTKEYGMKEVRVNCKKPTDMDKIEKDINGVNIEGVSIKLKNIPSRKLKKTLLTVKPADVEIMKLEVK